MSDCSNINVNTCDNGVVNNINEMPTMEDAKNAYISSLLADIAKLQSDLENEKLNCNRFQQLYQACLAYVMMAIQKNDINELAGVTQKLAEIEAKV